MNDTNITCPKCGTAIPLTGAVSHSRREQPASGFEQQPAKLNPALPDRAALPKSVPCH